MKNGQCLSQIANRLIDLRVLTNMRVLFIKFKFVFNSLLAVFFNTSTQCYF